MMGVNETCAMAVLRRPSLSRGARRSAARLASLLFALLALVVAFPCSAARAFTPSTTYLEYGGAVLTAYPFTMACWFNVANITGDHYLMSIADVSTGTNWWALVAFGSVAGDPVSLASRSGGSTNFANTSTGFSASTWTHACGVGTSATSRNSYINGGSVGSNTTSSTPAGLDNTGIGQVHTSGGHIGIPLGSEIGRASCRERV